MFEMFPNIDIGKDAKYPLSSYLFGHRMRPNQSDIESFFLKSIVLSIPLKVCYSEPH